MNGLHYGSSGLQHWQPTDVPTEAEAEMIRRCGPVMGAQFNEFQITKYTLPIFIIVM
jgi:hypothetical protein